MESARLIETVKRAQNGDEEALLALYLDIHQNVYYLALKMMKNTNDAEDMTQDVFITIQEKIAGLQEPAAFYRWINQITANKCTSSLRKRRELSGFEEDSGVWVQEENDHMMLPDKAFDDAETRRLIIEVIDNLPVNQRVCVYYYYYELLAISQIAETLETNENTVKSRLALARGKIKAELERKEREEGIKLYAIPLALTPILRQAMEQFTVPEGVAERMWENISKAAKSAPPDGSNSNKPDSSDGNPPGQGNHPASDASATSAASTAATGAGMALGVKIIIGVIAVAVVAAGAIVIPRMINTPPDGSPLPAVTDTQTPAATYGQTDTPGSEQNEQPSPEDIDQTEIPNAEQDESTQVVSGAHEINGGTYDGELLDGKSHGYGVWVYENYRYEGLWENDLPNGEGTLIELYTLPLDEPNGGTIEIRISGVFHNGLADGPASGLWIMPDGTEHDFLFSLNKGYIPVGSSKCSDCGIEFYFDEGALYGGVPPWWIRYH